MIRVRRKEIDLKDVEAKQRHQEDRGLGTTRFCQFGKSKPLFIYDFRFYVTYILPGSADHEDFLLSPIFHIEDSLSGLMRRIPHQSWHIIYPESPEIAWHNQSILNKAIKTAFGLK